MSSVAIDSRKKSAASLRAAKVPIHKSTDIPSGWTRKPLGDLLEEVDERARSLVTHERKKLVVFSLTKRFGLIPQTDRFKRRVAAEDTSKYKVLRRGQIAYNPFVIWEGAIHALRGADAALVSPAYVTWSSRELDGGYLDLLLRTPEVISAYDRLSSGAVNRRRSIRREGFLSIEVLIPPLEERRSIGAALDAIRGALDASERVTAATRELKRSLSRHCFTHGAVSTKDAERVILRESEIGPVPAAWRIARLGEVVEIARGQVDPRESPYREMRHVGPENIESETGRLLGATPAGDLGLISGKYLFTEADVLYSKIRPYLRKAALPTFRGLCSADMYPIRPTPGLNRRYLFHWLLSDAFTATIVPSQGRTGIPKVNRVQLASTTIPIPESSEQEHIATILDAVDSKFSRERARAQSLGRLYESLLRDLTTGTRHLPEFTNGS